MWIDRGTLATGDGLLTDLELINRRLFFAEHDDDPGRRINMLQGGMELVKGRGCGFPGRGRRCWT